MDITFYQTAELRLANVYNALQTYALRPLLPFAARNKGDVKIVGSNGIITYWYKNGTIRQELPSGHTLLFPPKPTFKEAFENPPTGYYYEFHQDGSITIQVKDHVAHWSANVLGPITHGATYYTHMCKKWLVFDDECSGDCSRACDCSDDESRDDSY
jgi:hypothetical protein